MADAGVSAKEELRKSESNLCTAHPVKETAKPAGPAGGIAVRRCLELFREEGLCADRSECVRKGADNSEGAQSVRTVEDIQGRSIQADAESVWHELNHIFCSVPHLARLLKSEMIAQHFGRDRQGRLIPPHVARTRRQHGRRDGTCPTAKRRILRFSRLSSRHHLPRRRSVGRCSNDRS